jgi:aminoglycoside phosphotransferase family enzyme/predicted kinase
METPSQEVLFKAMADPDLYPHPVRSVTCKETHISKVFLTGQRVYKIKKAIDLGFLDFSTLARRRHYCEREVALNRRMTHGVYREVAAIRHADGRFNLSGSGDVVEYAVCMRQLPDKDSLAARLHRDAVSVEQVEALALRLIDFYRRQGPVRPDLAAASRENVRSACEENFRQMGWAVGELLDPERYRNVASATRSFLSLRKPLFRNRIEKGCIRDCHGDLRTGHIYFDRAGSFQIIDCIEFNPRLRHIDMASDLAFLIMDLDAKGAAKLALALMEAYVRETGDFQAYALLPFYMGYRAMVRCKVSCIRLKEAAPGENRALGARDAAMHYLTCAYRYTQHCIRPTLWVLCGLPAAGKSTLARALSRILMVKVWRSDVVRKQMVAPAAARPASGEAIELYSESMHRRTYATLLDLARTALDHGQSVILDATFSQPEDRRKARALAGQLNCHILFVECTAPAHQRKRRLGQREGGNSASDARLHHFEQLNRRYIPLDEVDPTLRVGVDTTRPLHHCIPVPLARHWADALAGADDVRQTASQAIDKGGGHVQNHSGGNRPHHRERSCGGGGGASGRREQQPSCYPPCS